MAKRGKRSRKPGKLPPTQAVRYYDPKGLAKKARQSRDLQRRFDRLCGPVTVRNIGDDPVEEEK